MILSIMFPGGFNILILLRICNQLQIHVIRFFFKIQGYVSLIQHSQRKFNEADRKARLSSTPIQSSTPHSSTRLFFFESIPSKYVCSRLGYFIFFI